MSQSNYLFGFCRVSEEKKKRSNLRMAKYQERKRKTRAHFSIILFFYQVGRR